MTDVLPANLSWLAERGILLDNNYAVTHPSEPNYFAAVCGDYFGMQNDAVNRADQNVSTVFDLLDTRGISWAAYQEDLPYSGFEGKGWVNQRNGANDYVRKHNPPAFFDSVTRSEQRLSQIKNISMIDTAASMFHRDLAADELPQWMFITPNMTSDGHDTSVTVAGTWTHDFLEPLLDDPKFMKNTLVLITFDENHTYTSSNRVHGILLGDAVPKHKVGTVDSHFYNHYSELSTVQANWDLHSLGRWDVGANVYEVVAEKTKAKVREWSGETPLSGMFWNQSYAGVFNTAKNDMNRMYVAPNLDLKKNAANKGVLEEVKRIWKRSELDTYYEDSIEVPDGLHPPKGYKA